MSALAFADLAVRLVAGIAAGLLIVSPGSTSTAFVRTAWLIVIGLLTAVIAVLTGVPAEPTTLLALAALLVVALLASVSGGIGPSRFASGSAAITAITGLLLLSGFPGDGGPALLALNRAASSLLLGTTMLAMVLGHHYLTAPTMSLEPLNRLVLAAGVAVASRVVLSAFGTIEAWSAPSGVRLEGTWPFFLAIRWGMGLVVPAIGLALTSGALRLRATQSATGILYVVVTLTLVGELSALILSRGLGIAI